MKRPARAEVTTLCFVVRPLSCETPGPGGVTTLCFFVCDRSRMKRPARAGVTTPRASNNSGVHMHSDPLASAALGRVSTLNCLLPQLFDIGALPVHLLRQVFLDGTKPDTTIVFSLCLSLGRYKPIFGF